MATEGYNAQVFGGRDDGLWICSTRRVIHLAGYDREGNPSTFTYRFEQHGLHPRWVFDSVAALGGALTG